MSDEKKPVRTLELQVDVDAPLDAAWKAITEGEGLANWFAPISKVSGPGLGATVSNGWSEEMMMTGTVDAWEPMKHVRWLDESGWMGPDTALAVDYYLSSKKGKTRIRLVQSAFGENEGWDDLFDGTEVGWTYFLYNLRVYLERHLGRTRRMISERLPVEMPRARFWEHLLSHLRAPGSLKAGDHVALDLGEPAPVDAVAEVVIEEHGLGLRIPQLADALVFMELEGNSDRFHVGYWFSVYDDAQAGRVEAPARRAFQRIHETMPGA